MVAGAIYLDVPSVKVIKCLAGSKWFSQPSLGFLKFDDSPDLIKCVHSVLGKFHGFLYGYCGFWKRNFLDSL